MAKIKIGSSAEKGRCLFADANITPGEIVIDQEPYVSVLDADSRSKRCDGCFKELKHLKRCSACKFVSYCSRSCQKSEWTIHQQECKLLIRCKSEYDRIPTPSLQLMLRLIIKRKLQMSTEVYGICRLVSVQPFAEKFCFLKSVEDMSETCEERLVLYAQMANLVKLIADDDEVDIKDITEMFCRFSCNAHTICDEELRPIGTALFPLISLLNHSCSPNAVLSFQGKRGVVRAIERINNLCEVTIPYIELGANTGNRRKALKEHYFFDCSCLRCKQVNAEDGYKQDVRLEGFRCSNSSCEGSVDSKLLRCVVCDGLRNADEIEKLSNEADAFVKEGNFLFNSSRISEARSAFEKAEALQVKIYNPVAVQLMRTYDMLVKMSMCLQDWTSALKYCRLAIPAYEIAYSGMNPLLGLELYTAGKLEWHLGKTKEAVKSLRRAKEILEITNGREGELMRELCNILQEATAEERHFN